MNIEYLWYAIYLILPTKVIIVLLERKKIIPDMDERLKGKNTATKTRRHKEKKLTKTLEALCLCGENNKKHTKHE